MKLCFKKVVMSTLLCAGIGLCCSTVSNFKTCAVAKEIVIFSDSVVKSVSTNPNKSNETCCVVESEDGNVTTTVSGTTGPFECKLNEGDKIKNKNQAICTFDKEKGGTMSVKIKCKDDAKDNNVVKKILDL